MTLLLFIYLLSVCGAICIFTDEVVGIDRNRDLTPLGWVSLALLILAPLLNTFVCVVCIWDIFRWRGK